MAEHKAGISCLASGNGSNLQAVRILHPSAPYGSAKYHPQMPLASDLVSNAHPFYHRRKLTRPLCS